MLWISLCEQLWHTVIALHRVNYCNVKSHVQWALEKLWDANSESEVSWNVSHQGLRINQALPRAQWINYLLTFTTISLPAEVCPPAIYSSYLWSLGNIVPCKGTAAADGLRERILDWDLENKVCVYVCCVTVCMCVDIRVSFRSQRSDLLWDLKTEVRLLGVCGSCLYLLGHLSGLKTTFFFPDTPVYVYYKQLLYIYLEKGNFVIIGPLLPKIYSYETTNLYYYSPFNSQIL